MPLCFFKSQNAHGKYNQNTIVLNRLFLKDTKRTQFWYAIPFTSQVWTPEVSEGLKPYILCHKTYWYKNAFKTISLWFLFFCFFSYLHGSSTKMSRKLTLLFTFFWVWTPLGSPVNANTRIRPASGWVCLPLSRPFCSFYKKEMLTAVILDNLWSLSWCKCTVSSTWLPALECRI